MNIHDLASAVKYLNHCRTHQNDPTDLFEALVASLNDIHRWKKEIDDRLTNLEQSLVDLSKTKPPEKEKLKTIRK